MLKLILDNQTGDISIAHNALSNIVTKNADKLVEGLEKMKDLFSQAKQEAPTLSLSMLKNIDDIRNDIQTLTASNRDSNNGQLDILGHIDEINIKLSNIMNQSGEAMDKKLQAITATFDVRIRASNSGNVNDNIIQAATIREMHTALAKIKAFDVDEQFKTIKKALNERLDLALKNYDSKVSEHNETLKQTTDEQKVAINKLKIADTEHTRTY